LLEQIGGSRKKLIAAVDEGEITFDPKLNLTIRNSGDLLIRNNVGTIDLQADVTVKGLRSKPIIEGVINTREGKLEYMGLDFDITKGFIEFRDPYTRPYMEVDAQRELRLYNINMRLYGRIDNLNLDLEGSSPTGSLEKRDIISLLTSGITERERRESQFDGRERKLGVSVAAQQVGQMLERPISELTHLDIFRIEAAEPEDIDEPGKVATRLRVGKQLTDRLSVDFSTDIDTKDAEQTITTEYLITDNLIIKGSRGSDSHYRGRIGLRFRLR
jgi:translocation and assembly module TamB